MQILASPQKLRDLCAEWHRKGERIALVPTMGYCHAGHEALMDYGRKQADRLVVSLFVNPAQFGPDEDLARYPRDLERDTAIIAAKGADVLFAPEIGDMYSPDHATWVEVPEMAQTLCGKSRPIHFRGVCTVVLKLLMLTMADVAVFGEKDWQQQAILKRMAQDLNLAVRIMACPTVREVDGLALSSRNVYLTDSERQQAPAIRKALLRAREMVEKGERNVYVLTDFVRKFWQEAMPDAEPDYLSVVHPSTLASLETITGSALMACAVKLGKARLIDNIILHD